MTYSAIDTAHDDDAPDGLRGGAWPVGDGWRDIGDCAPKDGTDVLVYCADSGEQFVAFNEGEDGIWIFARHSRGEIACSPHYWMPLPTPPVGAA